MRHSKHSKKHSKKSRRLLIRFEPCEPRWLLSVTPVFDGINLTLSGSADSGTLTVTQGAGSVSAQDGAQNFGPFAVTGFLEVAGTGLADNVPINLAGTSAGAV